MIFAYFLDKKSKETFTGRGVRWAQNPSVRANIVAGRGWGGGETSSAYVKKGPDIAFLYDF